MANFPFAYLDLSFFPPTTANLLRNAVQSILTDRGFRINSSNAREVLRSAENMLEWVSDKDNQVQVAKFCEELQGRLQVSLPESKGEREQMWATYHRARVSTFFRQFWADFLKTVGVEPSPLLYQYLTDTIFQEMMSMSCAVSTDDGPESDTHQSPTYEECNALRYIAGYVCSKVQKKIEDSKHPHRDDLLLCLMDIRDEEVDAGNSSDWTNTVDRGGLCKVNESNS